MNIKRTAAALLAAALCALSLAGCAKKAESTDSAETSLTEQSAFYTSQVDDPMDESMGSLEFTAQIKVGWNLGNTLDATGGTGVASEISWGAPKTTEALILAVKDAGFNAVRVPTSWGLHMDEQYNIDEEWMARVNEVVDYAYNNDMYVILNMHHEEWNYPYESNKEQGAQILTKAWTQIAERFAKYGERLIFEGMNEPRWVGTEQEWNGGNDEGRSVVNYFDKVFVDAVRATGGNNANRFLMVCPYAANSGEDALSALVIPEDSAQDRLIVSVHAYIPYSFALQKDGTAKWLAERTPCTREIDGLAELLDRLFISRGQAVIIGEMGAMNRYYENDEGKTIPNEEYRAQWAEYYTKTMKQHGIPCFVWDNNAIYSGETFGIFDRTTGECRFPDYTAGLVKGAEQQ